MGRSLQKQPQITILPDLSVNAKLRLGKAEIAEIIKTVQGALPRHVDGDDLTITLVEKNLKIMADKALMREAITHLVRNAMPDCRKYSLTIDQVNFKIESLLASDDSLIGTCAFISLSGIGTYICVDNKIREKILEPFFTTKIEPNGIILALDYRVIKPQQERIQIESRGRQVTEANIYLPLTKSDIVNILSISTG